MLNAMRRYTGTDTLDEPIMTTIVSLYPDYCECD